MTSSPALLRTRRASPALAALALANAALAILVAAPGAHAGDPPRVVFIRGGFGTGGFLEGGSTEHLSDIDNTTQGGGNHGFGELRQRLEADGYLVEQVVEGPISNNTPVDLTALDLDTLDVLVLGSNNAAYDAADADLLADWVCQGGAALFISDANWGTNWGDAPSSDQTFLDRFDLVMNQDTATYVLERATGDFVVGGVDMGDHPVLAGPDGQLGTGDDVDAFDGEGVSPLTVVDAIPNVTPIVLAQAEIMIHVNDSFGSGSFRAPTPADGALVALEYGTGRVAGHFDRNTFFNEGGAGTDINNHDNEQYASNLFAWLVAAPGTRYGAGCAGLGGFVPELSLDGCPRLGGSIDVTLRDAPGGHVAYLLFGLTEGTGVLPNGCPLLVDPVVPFQIVLPLAGGAGPGEGTLDIPGTIPIDFPAASFTLQAFIPGGGAFGGVAASNGLRVTVF